MNIRLIYILGFAVIVFLGTVTIFSFKSIKKQKSPEVENNTDIIEPISVKKNKTNKNQYYSECKRGFCIEANTQGDTIQYSFQNNRNIHITISFQFYLNNIILTSGEYFSVSIPQNSTIELPTGIITDIDKPYKWDYRYEFRYGDINAIHNDYYIYQLPYSLNSTYEVTQSHYGKTSHNDQYNMYAVDFNMPMRTQVCAARDGYVAETRKYSTINGPSKGNLSIAHGHFVVNIRDIGNYIIIAHDDGTVAQYLHLDFDSIFVDEDDYVQKGEVIALSGNTGISNAPHLHFNVAKPSRNGKYESIPVKFSTKKGIIYRPEEGKAYTASP